MKFASKSGIFIVCTGIIAVALILRFHNLYDSVSFRGDQSWDLFIARSISEEGHTVSLGPVLSVKQFYIPTVYYHFLSWLYTIFRTPEGVTFSFTLMALIAMACMVRLSILLIGYEAGIIMAFLISISSSMVSQGRMMWQPFPITLFLALYLLLTLEGTRRKSILLHFLSLVSYFFALSVYVSPILLLPYVIYQGVRFYRHLTVYPYSTCVFLVAVAMILASMPFYGRYVVYEWQSGLPTFRALQSPAFGSSQTIRSAIDMYEIYIVGFIEEMFNQTAITNLDTGNMQTVVSWAVIILLLSPWLFRKYFDPKFDSLKRSVRDFIGLPWLLLGSLIILWFQKTIYVYRILVFIPFFLLGLTFILYLALKSRPNVYSLFAGMILVIYTAGNVNRIQLSQFDYPRGEVDRAARASMIIGYDAARTRLRKGDYIVGISNNYSILPFLYYLRDFANYRLPFSPGGNDFDKRSMTYPSNHPYVYLICIRHGIIYQSVEASVKSCKADFFNQNSSYCLESIQKINEDDYVLKFSLTTKAQCKTM